MSKLYFRKDDAEICYPLSYWLDILKFEKLSELVLFEAKPTKDNEYFFCRAVGEVGERGECGRHCEDYTPKNGKNGCCKYVGGLYEATDKTRIIKN